MRARPVPLDRSERSRLLARLGLEPDAPPDAVRHAYRRLALRLHPDHGGDPADTAHFLAVEDAYRRLVADDRAIETATTKKQPGAAPEARPTTSAAPPPHLRVGQSPRAEFAAGPVQWSPPRAEGPDR